MTVRVFLVTLALLVAPLPATVQPPGKVYRIGYLATIPPPAHLWEALLDGLRERGYSEGRNLVFERRFSEGNADVSRYLLQMVQRRVDLVIAITTPAALAVQNATTTIPIVMTTAIDPVGAGLVASLARPGGTVTGNAMLYAELSTKRLEFLKDVVPGLSRVVVLWNAAHPANASVWHETQAAAGALGLVLHAQDVRGAQDFAGAFARTAQAHPDGLLVLDDALIAMHRQHIAEFATQAAPAERVCRQRIGHGRRSDVLWTEPAGPLPSCGHVRGQDPARRQTGRSTHGAAHEIRAGHQSQDRPGPWAHHPPAPPDPGGQGDPVSQED